MARDADLANDCAAGLLYRAPMVLPMTAGGDPKPYRHGYEGVDESLIWYTAQNGTEALRRLATMELESLASGDAK
jgi:hypothetical protein